MIEIAGLRKSLSSRPVLSGLEMRLEGGSITGLVGPSGSGKTTLLRIIAGLDRADDGLIHVDGQTVESPCARVPPHQRGVGMVPQDLALWPHLTVAEHVAFGLPRQSLGRGRLAPVVAAALDQVHLAVPFRALPHQLSAGERQRLALARTLATAPRFVLLDEPFANIDMAVRVDLINDLKRLFRSLRVTVLFVTHDLNDALALGERLAVLSDGRIAEHGDNKTLMDGPRSAFLRSLAALRP